MRGALALFATLAVAACNSGSSDDDPPASAQSGLFGRVTADGSGLAGARVTLGGASATTDGEGRYRLAAGAGPGVAQIVAAGHVINVQKVRVDGPTALDVVLLPEAPPQALDASAGGTVEGARGARVVVPPGALVDPAGATVVGAVAVHLTPIDPANPDQLAAAPGAFEARTSTGATAQLETFGMLDVTIRQGDAVLQVAPGQTLEIAIPAPTGQGELPAGMPLWSFDEAQGVWVEEGTLALDAASGTYVGSIAHMSVWNADRPLETTCITGTVVDADSGAPLAGARVSGRGVDYLGTDATHADATGRFTLLVRKSSTVAIAAYHAEGGGEIREVQSGDATAGRPVDPDVCLDGGTWTVRRGEVVFEGGATYRCEADVFDQLDLTACVPLLADLTRCHQPSGACTQAGLLDIEYANGAAVRTMIGDAGGVTIEFFGPGGVACGQQVVSGASAAGGEVSIVLPDGRQASYGVQLDASDGGITYVCADGSRRTITGANQQRLQACSGASDACEQADRPPIGGACDTAADCQGGLVCCVGVCIERASCPFVSCDDDAQCGEGEMCCPGTNSCLSQAQCVESGWCGGDSDCGDGRACCDGMCTDRPFCEGACRVDGDCGAGLCCAPDGGETWCAEDAVQCFSGIACADDAACGDPASLTCCGGTCETWATCYQGTECADQSACGGAESPIECCEREGILTCEDRVECASFRLCDAETPCGAGTMCCNNPALFDGEICLPPEICFVNLPCGTDADCGGIDCCAIPNQEPVCVQGCPAEWRQP